MELGLLILLVLMVVFGGAMLYRRLDDVQASLQALNDRHQQLQTAVRETRHLSHGRGPAK